MMMMQSTKRLFAHLHDTLWSTLRWNSQRLCFCAYRGTSFTVCVVASHQAQ
jgi:hypothetical protein